MPNSSRPFDVVSDSASDEASERQNAGRVLLLGAGGFLGQHVSKRLSKQGIDHVRIGHTGGVDVDGTIDLVSSAQHDLDQLIARIAPTAVINCAGATHGSAADLTQGNVVAVHSLLMSLAWNTPSARLIQLGSSAEYGGASHGTRMDEHTETTPSSAYGYTKLAASELVLRAIRQGMDAVVLRIFNVSGPGSPGSTMLGRLVDELHDAPDNDPTVTLDSLDGWRDYVDVRDVADAICRATIRDRLPSVINIGSGTAVQTGQWVQDLIASSKPTAKIVQRSNPHGTHKASAGAVAWQCADISLARSRLDWEPTVALPQSLADTWEDRQQHTAV
jgi:nucleoside-diphosphate-sugar epimerase